MNPDLLEYNFQFLNDIYQDEDDTSYEKYKIMDRIDREVFDHQKVNVKWIYHAVPILYTCVFALGTVSFIFKIYPAIY